MLYYLCLIFHSLYRYLYKSITMNNPSGGDRIPVDLFQILEDDAVKVLHSICQQIWETQQWPQDTKMSVFITIPKKGNARECSNYHIIALISYASRLCSKSFKLGFSSMWTKNFQMFNLNLEKAMERKSNCHNSLNHRESKRIPEKHLLLLHGLHWSLSLCSSQHTMENSLR